MNKKIPIFLGLLFFFFLIWLQTSSIQSVHQVVEQLENVAYDWRIRANSLTQQHKKFVTSVLIVDIDDKSLAAEGRWPWPRSKIANLVDAIQAGGAAVVTLDLIFPQKETNIASEVFNEIHKQNLNITNLQSVFEKISPVFDYDILLGRSLEGGDTVLGFGFNTEVSTQGYITPPLLTLTPNEEKHLDMMHADGFIGVNTTLAPSVKNMGFVNYLNTEGIVRRVPLVIEYNRGIYPSLALETARIYLLSQIKLITADYGEDINLEGIKIGGVSIPTDKEGQAFIPFRGSSFTFPYYSATDVLNKRILPKTFEGKIVYIGTSATGLADLKPTSVSNIFPGVEIQATITDGILKNDFWYKPAWAVGAEVMITFLLGCIFVFVYPFLGPRVLILLTLTLPFLIVYIDNILLQQTKLILSVFFPVILAVLLGILNIIYGYLFESRHRARLNNMFGQYVPKEHIEHMMRSTGDYGLHGETRDMSVLFSDIRGFTHISETMAAEQLKELLNEVLTPLTEVIFNSNGTIDKYIGDAIMAFWGAPLNDSDHVRHALSAALNMQDSLQKLAPKIAERGWPPVKIGIGINRGKMIVGDMGSKYRRNYTVLGDEVNLASRVEGLTKHYGVSTIVTEEAQRDQTEFLFRHLDRIRVVGKMQPTNIYEIICYRKDATPELLNEITLSDSGFDFYLKKEWDKAVVIFQELKKHHPDTKFYKLYVERCYEYKAYLSEDGWDGTYVHTSK
jgi:adenylate cyclase